MTSIPRARELAGRAASVSGAALAALLVPKCPLCAAAYLAALGLSAEGAHMAAPFVRPLLLLIAIGATIALAVGAWRLRGRERREAASSCCCK